MKILLISASPRKEKSQTFLLANEILKGFSEEKTTEILHLCDMKISFCRSCEACHKKILDCPIKDDVQYILKMMLEVDGIVLASPNYINQVPGVMKTLFDRSTHFIHCLRLTNKYTVGVVTSGSGYDKSVLDYLKHYSNVCGAQYVGSVSTSVPINNENLTAAFKLGRRFCSAIKEKKEFPSQLKIIEKNRDHFRKIVQARKNDWIEEYNYWLSMTWL